MKNFFSALLGIWITVALFSACKEKSIMDRSIYEDFTAAEVLEISESIPSFRFFYDNIRAKIVAKSNEYDREQFKGVTYKSIYELFNYWSSADFAGLIESTQNAYSRKMAAYQIQIDSISEHFRSIVDSVKVEGAPQFDFARIFKHPELCYIYNDSYFGFPNGLTRISFSLPIRNLGLFNETGINHLDFHVVLFEKGKPNGPIAHLNEKFSMDIYDGNEWGYCDPKDRIPKHWDGLYLDSVPVFMNAYDRQKNPAENFNNVFDWYYEVESIGVPYKTSGATYAFNDYLKHTIPSPVYSYWEAEEGSDVSKYVNARNNMIKEYIDEDYVPSSQSFPDEIEGYLLDQYRDEFMLYQLVREADPKMTEEFEVMVEKVRINCSEWVPVGFRLPIIHPNGNYVKTAEYDKRIYREGCGPEYL